MVDAQALRAASEGLGSYRSWLEQVASRHETFATRLDGQMDRLADVWRSPVGVQHVTEGRRIAGRHRRVLAPLRDAAGATRTLATTANALATRMQGLASEREQVHAQLWRARAVAAASAAVPVVGAAGGGIAAATNQVAQLQAQLNSLERRIGQVAVDWDQACRTARSRIEPVVAAVSPDQDDRAEAIAWALLQLNTTPGSWSSVPHGDAWFDALVAARLADPTGSPEAVRRAAAERMLGELPEQLLTELRDGRFDAATLDALERALAAHPVVGVVLLETLGPIGLTTLPYALEVHASSGMLPVHHDGGDGPVYGIAAYLRDGNRVVDLLATALGSASHRPELDPGFVDGLIAAADTEHGAAFGLSLLLHRGGTYDRDVALRLAEGLYAIERTDGPHAWMRRADTGRGLPDQLDTVSSFDVMTGVSAMLARDATAAQDFLLGADPSGGSRVAWLTANRDWGFEAGASYGAMVQAATTQLRDMDGHGSPGWRSADVTAQFLAALPARTVDGTVVSYDVPDGLRAPIGVILGTYVDDLGGRVNPTFGVREAPSDLLPDDRQAYGIWLPQHSVRPLLDAVVDDPTAYRAILAGQHALLQLQLDHVTDRHAAHQLPPTTLLDQVARQAAIVGLVDDVVRQRDIRDAAAADARAASVANLGTSAVSAVPIPGGPLTGIAVGRLADVIASELTPDTAWEQRAVADDASRVVRDNLQHHVLSAMFEAGWFDDGEYAAQHPDRTMVQLIDADADEHAALSFLAPDGTLRAYDELSERQQGVFDSWKQRRFSDVEFLDQADRSFTRARQDYGRQW